MISSSDLNIRRHIQSYYSKLLTGQEFFVSELFDSYRQMVPTIHKHLFDNNIDVDILNYCLNRLPPQIFSTENIIIGQNYKTLSNSQANFDKWASVGAKSRRRRCYCSPDSYTLATIITSDSDIDDLVNNLIALEIEFNKIKLLLKNYQNQPLAELLKLNQNESHKLYKLFGQNQNIIIDSIKIFHGFRIQLIDYQPNKYLDTVKNWWQELQQKMLVFGIENIPVYFVSSNLHSLLNITGGYITAHQTQVYDYLRLNDPELYAQLLQIEAKPTIFRKEDFFYYASSKYLINNPKIAIKKQLWEKELGIKNLILNHDLYCDAQLIPVSALASSTFLDPGLNITNRQKITSSQGVIINIDYPLGFSAYLVLSEILKSLNQIVGIYIVGKSAILQGNVGDVQIPRQVFDERLNNVFSFNNCFDQNFPVKSKNFEILKSQKAISVQGVLLENKSQIDNYQKSNFNIVEMESGSYLSAIAQKYKYENQFPKNQVCQLNDLPFDLGIINYASDNPLSTNLGQGPLSLRGVEPAYASLLTIVQRIIDIEESK